MRVPGERSAALGDRAVRAGEPGAVEGERRAGCRSAAVRRDEVIRIIREQPWARKGRASRSRKWPPPGELSDLRIPALRKRMDLGRLLVLRNMAIHGAIQALPGVREAPFGGQWGMRGAVLAWPGQEVGAVLASPGAEDPGLPPQTRLKPAANRLEQRSDPTTAPLFQPPSGGLSGSARGLQPRAKPGRRELLAAGAATRAAGGNDGYPPQRPGAAPASTAATRPAV